MLYKLAFLFVLLTLFMSNSSKSQQYHYSISYEEFGVFFNPNKCIDTIEFDLSGKFKGCKLRLFLKDCRGEAYFELFDKKCDLKMSGHYDNAIDTLKKYRLRRYLGQSEGDEKYRVSLIQYLYPLQVGEWIYIEGEGKKKKQRIVTYTYTTE